MRDDDFEIVLIGLNILAVPKRRRSRDDDESDSGERPQGPRGLVVRPATEADEALTNPSGKTLALMGGAALLGAGVAWAFYRSQARADLAVLLSSSAMVQTALQKGLVVWTPEDKAAELVGYTNATSAEQGYALVLAELTKLMPPDPEEMTDLSTDALRLIEEKTGIDVAALKAQAASLKESAASYLPSWITGG